MANLDPLKIYTFARITRTQEPYALHKLMEREGDINAALDDHYRFEDTTNIYVPDSEYNMIDMDTFTREFLTDEVPESLLCDIDESEEEAIEEEDGQSSMEEEIESRDVVPATSLTDAFAFDEWLALYEEAMNAEVSDGSDELVSLTPRTPSPLAEAQLLKRKKQVCQLKIQATRKMKEEQQLGVKEASLPLEPAIDEENAVTILIRMPNGNRLTRCFMTSHYLQMIFDFIDISRLVKPNTYRLVRSFPIETFGAEQSCLTLQELGLINKQEALFLEMI